MLGEQNGQRRTQNILEGRREPKRRSFLFSAQRPFHPFSHLPRPRSPVARGKGAGKWVMGEKGTRRRDSLGWRPEGPRRPVEERGRTRREGRRASFSRTRTRDTRLLLSCSAPTLTAPVSTKAKSTDINLSHTNNSASPLLSIPNSPNAPPPLSLLLHR